MNGYDHEIDPSDLLPVDLTACELSFHDKQSRIRRPKCWLLQDAILIKGSSADFLENEQTIRLYATRRCKSVGKSTPPQRN